MKRKITQKFVDDVKPPRTGRAEYVDAGFTGLTLRVTDKGHKSWSLLYQHGGKLHRLTLGEARTVEMEGGKGRLLDHMAARKAAFAAMELIKAGKDPIAEREAAAQRAQAAADNTVRAVVADYLERYVKPRCRASTYAVAKRDLEVDVVPHWAKRPIASITRHDVSALLHRTVARGAPVHANVLLSKLKTLFQWCVDEELIDRSPIARMKPPTKEKSRERVLTTEEIKTLWRACNKEAWPYGAIVKLLLLTGQRRSEVAEMRWAEIDLKAKVWTIPRERAKNNHAHDVQLSDAAINIIKALPRVDRAALVFTYGSARMSGFSAAKTRLADAMPGTARDWSFHDLRRTAATLMAGELKIAPHIADKILNHVGGSIHGIAAIYNRAEYVEERRAALDAWARYVMSIVGEGASAKNVYEFKRGWTRTPRAAASA